MGMVANNEEVALAKLSRFASVSLIIVQWGKKRHILFSKIVRTPNGSIFKRHSKSGCIKSGFEWKKENGV